MLRLWPFVSNALNFQKKWQYGTYSCNHAPPPSSQPGGRSGYSLCLKNAADPPPRDQNGLQVACEGVFTRQDCICSMVSSPGTAHRHLATPPGPILAAPASWCFWPLPPRVARVNLIKMRVSTSSSCACQPHQNARVNLGGPRENPITLPKLGSLCCMC